MRRRSRSVSAVAVQQRMEAKARRRRMPCGEPAVLSGGGELRGRRTREVRGEEGGGERSSSAAQSQPRAQCLWEWGLKNLWNPFL